MIFEGREISALKLMNVFSSLHEVPTYQLREQIQLPRELNSIAQRFKAVANLLPENLAIKTNTNEISYADLDSRSDSVARYLIELGFDKSKPILITTSDFIFFVMGLLGVLKAGGFYVPLSKHCTSTQADEILKFIDPEIILLSSSLDLNSESSKKKLLISELSSRYDRLDFYPVEASKYSFILFTSGSTGKPKGALQYQTSILHNAYSQIENLNICAADRFSQIHSEATMGAARAIFNALLSGASLFPFTLTDQDLRSFLDWITWAKPSILHSSASFFRFFAGSTEDNSIFDSVRIMILGGEAVIERDFSLFQKLLSDNCFLCTGLGSSETTTVRMMLLTKKSNPEFAFGRLPLGFIANNTKIHLKNTDIDSSQNTWGEIVVEGPTCFAGYWPVENNMIIKHTHNMGDTAFVKPNGVMYHAGRKDDVIKIRGERVSLLALEEVLRAIPGVADVVVITVPDSFIGNRIYIFATASDLYALSTHKIRYFVRKSFSKAYQPSGVYLMEKIPRISAGKVNLAQLRLYLESTKYSDVSLASHKARYQGVEKTLFSCFERTSYTFLRRWCESVGPDTNFLEAKLRDFDIDSLTGLEVCLNIEELFKVRISPDELFRFRKVEHLLEWLSCHV